MKFKKFGINKIFSGTEYISGMLYKITTKWKKYFKVHFSYLMYYIAEIKKMMETKQHV